MRITVMANIAKGLRSPPDPDSPPGPQVDPSARAGEQLQRLKQFLWHGNVFRALQVVDDLAIDLDIADPGPQQRNLLKALRDFATYIRGNEGSIPNYGERHRAGEAISSSLAESAVNEVVSKRMVKKQQMRWSHRGAQPPAPDPNACPQRRPRQRLPPLVPQLQPNPRPRGDRRVASHGFSRSPRTRDARPAHPPSALV